MARGKIQIKKIENQTNRQVTYSKRRNGLFKKASELTVLCDAKVSIIMISSTGKLHEFISPTTTTKQILDQYQKALGIDIWKSQYEEMQERLKRLNELNRNLNREIRQRVGENLNDLGYQEIVDLVDSIEHALNLIRERKYKSLSGQIDTARKKYKNAEDVNRGLILDIGARGADPYYGLFENDDGYNYNTVLGYHHGGSRVVAFRVPHERHQNRNGGGSDLTTFALLE